MKSARRNETGTRRTCRGIRLNSAVLRLGISCDWAQFATRSRKSEKPCQSEHGCRSRKPLRVDHSNKFRLWPMWRSNGNREWHRWAATPTDFRLAWRIGVQSVMALQITSEAQAAGGNSAAGQQGPAAAADRHVSAASERSSDSRLSIEIDGAKVR